VSRDLSVSPLAPAAHRGILRDDTVSELRIMRMDPRLRGDDNFWRIMNSTGPRVVARGDDVFKKPTTLYRD